MRHPRWQAALHSLTSGCEQAGGRPKRRACQSILLNSTSYLTAHLASGNLPGAHQGWGLLDLGRAFETTDRIIYDQAESRTFTESGGAPFEVTA